MRFSLYLFFVCIISLLLEGSVAAQGTLQFNQVLLFELDGSAPVNINIPSDKVWKIESCGVGSTSSSYAIFLRNSSGDQITYLFRNTSQMLPNLPFWLPSGFQGEFYKTGGTAVKGAVSVIEFNVVP